MVSSCAMTLPSTCAPSAMTRCEASMSPMTRPKTFTEPSQTILPVMSMSWPSVETISGDDSPDSAPWSNLIAPPVSLRLFLSRAPLDSEKTLNSTLLSHGRFLQHRRFTGFETPDEFDPIGLNAERVPARHL